MSVIYDVVISFMEEAIKNCGGDRYSVSQDSDGCATFIDHQRRICVKMAVTKIYVSKYSLESGELIDSTEIPWEELSLKQKQRIIDLLETSGEESEEVAAVIERIFNSE